MKAQFIGGLAGVDFVTVIGFQLPVSGRYLVFPVAIYILYPCHMRQIMEWEGNYGDFFLLGIYLENTFGCKELGPFRMKWNSLDKFSFQTVHQDSPTWRRQNINPPLRFIDLYIIDVLVLSCTLSDVAYLTDVCSIFLEELAWSPPSCHQDVMVG